MEVNTEHLLIEAAITNENEDLFNFNHYAKKVNSIIKQSFSNPQPITVGIYGKWGEGKTSFLNLLETHIKNNSRILKYSFNPWRYSTEDEMLFDFFQGLSRTLLIEETGKLKKAGKYILKFSRYLKAIKLSTSVGITQATKTKITFEPSKIFKALGEDLMGEPSLESLKDKVDNELLQSDYKVAIFIDDIDRLDKDEIYTLLKIIKLNANFKNLIYFITLDSEQVAKAIHQRYGTETNDGKLYLEKIINLPIFLPRIEKEDLQLFFDKKFSQIKSILNLTDKEDEYKKIYLDFNKYMFNSPRKIIRVLNSFYLSAHTLGNELNLADLFSIEYIKINHENCYNELKQYNLERKVFYEIEDIIDFNDDNGSKDNPNGFRKYLFETYPKTKELISHLFPSNSKQNSNLHIPKIKRELRVNTYEHYEKYFSLHIEGKISESKFKALKQNIKNKNTEFSNKIYNEIISDNKNIHKIIYKVEDLCEQLDNRFERDSFFNLIIMNLKQIPQKKDVYNNDYQLRLIAKIGVILNKDVENNNKKIAENISEHLDLNKISQFIMAFDHKHNYINKLKQIAINKAKKENYPFFSFSKDIYPRWIIHYWSQLDKSELNTYIKKHLKNIQLVGNLIQNFVSYWNDTYFGSLTFQEFQHMKSKIDIDMLYEKIIKIDSSLKNSTVDLSKLRSENQSSIEQIIEQFISYYKNDLN